MKRLFPLILNVVLISMLIFFSCNRPAKSDSSYLQGRWMVTFADADTALDWQVAMLIAETDSGIWEFTTDHRLFIPDIGSDSLIGLIYEFNADSNLLYVSGQPGAEKDELPIKVIDSNMFQIPPMKDLPVTMVFSRLRE